MLNAVPLTLSQANAFVGEIHRHHKEVVGHRFSFGVAVDTKLVGTVICGRPVAPKTEQYKILEVQDFVLTGQKTLVVFSTPTPLK